MTDKTTVQTQAARLRIKADERLERDTPESIKAVAEVDTDLLARATEVTEVIGYRALCVKCAWMDRDYYDTREDAQAYSDAHNWIVHGVQL